MAKKQTKKTTADKGGINNAYLGILKDFEGKKEKVLQGYLSKVNKIKKQGVKNIEAKSAQSDAKAAKKLLEDA